jgi:4,5-dihydroxyphthalate decarboxylase
MLRLRAAFANYPHTAALKDGRVGSDTVALDFEEVEPITRAFRRMVRTGDFDLCEIAVTTLAQAHFYGKGLTALPVVVMRGFHHHALMCPTGSKLRGPEDLAGKRIGVRAFSQTTGVWLRGILLDEHGVDHRDITWVTAEDAHLAEYPDPPNVERIRPDQDLRTMMLNGEIDAGVALVGIDETKIRSVFPDPEAASAAWYRKVGAYPVNHVICVKTALLDANPGLAEELFRMFVTAKAAATEPSAEERFRLLVDGDPVPYGLEANRAGIEICVRYAAEQRLVPEAYTPEVLFAQL